VQKILIVDDEEDLCRVLTNILKQDGYEVLAAHTGEDALAVIRRQPLDLILLDLRLSGMGGMEILQIIKQKGLNIQVIIMTAYGTPEGREEAKDLGVFEFIDKPFPVEEMLKVVRRALEHGSFPG